MRSESLLKLARKAHIPYPLFFAPKCVAAAQVELKTQKLLQGVKKGTYSLNSRAAVDLADIELIVKDLTRKQELVKKFDPSLGRNPIVGMLKKSRSHPSVTRTHSCPALRNQGCRWGLKPPASSRLREM